MSSPGYSYYVSADYRDQLENPSGKRYRVLYNGSVAADAMAAWSKAVTEGAEYVVLESLKEMAK